MPHDIEFLAVIHSLQSSALEFKQCIDTNIAISETGSITIPNTIAASLSALLELQHKIIAGYVEENHQIHDNLEKITNRLNS